MAMDKRQIMRNGVETSEINQFNSVNFG